MKRQGFTIIELLVVIALISLLAAILFPVFARAKDSAKRVVCLSNVRQLSLASLLYSGDYDDLFVPVVTESNFSAPNHGLYQDQNHFWYGLLQPYVKNGQLGSGGGYSFDGRNSIWRCPSDSSRVVANPVTPGSLFPSYGYNYHLAARNYSPPSGFSPDDPAVSPPLSIASAESPADLVFAGEARESNKLAPPFFEEWWDGVSWQQPQTNAADTYEKPQRHDGFAH